MTDIKWLIQAPSGHYLGIAADKPAQFFWTRTVEWAFPFGAEQQAEHMLAVLRPLAPALFGFESTLGNAEVVAHP